MRTCGGADLGRAAALPNRDVLAERQKRGMVGGCARSESAIPYRGRV